MTAINFVVISFAVWRISSLLVNENGPLDILKRFRYLISKNKSLYKMISCIWCVSIYISFVFSYLEYSIVGFNWLYIFVLTFAYSTSTIFIDGIVSYFFNPVENEIEDLVIEAD